MRSSPASPIWRNRSRSPCWATIRRCRRNSRPRCATRDWRSFARRMRGSAQPMALSSPLPVSAPHTGALAEYQGKELLAALGVPVPAGALARDAAAARAIAEHIGYPVVLKAQSATLAHKSDVGGVILAIADDGALMQ